MAQSDRAHRGRRPALARASSAGSRCWGRHRDARRRCEGGQGANLVARRLARAQQAHLLAQQQRRLRLDDADLRERVAGLLQEGQRAERIARHRLIRLPCRLGASARQHLIHHACILSALPTASAASGPRLAPVGRQRSMRPLPVKRARWRTSYRTAALAATSPKRAIQMAARSPRQSLAVETAPGWPAGREVRLRGLGPSGGVADAHSQLE